MSDEYDQKLRDMQKYVPFLENLIQNLKKSNKHDEKREAQLNKMQMFYELLTNKNKKLKLETLERCEQVLVKLYLKAEKIKSELPIATDSSPAKLIITPVISTPEKINEHNYVPHKSTPSTALLLSPTSSVIQFESPTSAVTPIANPTPAITPFASPTPAVTPVAGGSVAEIALNASDLEKSKSSIIKLAVQPETQPIEQLKNSEENSVEKEPEIDNSLKNDEVADEDKHDDSTKCTDENIHMEDSEFSESKQSTVAIEQVQELVDSNNPSPASSKETVASTTDNADSISADTNEQTDIPPNVTDDWKSAKRKIDDNPNQDIDIPITDTANMTNTPETQEDQTVPMDIEEEEVNEPIEPESACSSMEIEEDNNQSQSAEETPDAAPPDLEDIRRKSVDTESNVTRPEQTVTSTMKNDPEECSVTSTTATDPRREKATEDESDEQNSLQDTVTDSSSNNEGTGKNWIPGALLNLLNPNTIDKSTVLNMLEKVVEGEKFQQIKAILAAEEESKKSAESEIQVKDEVDEKPTITAKAEDIKQENIEHSDEMDNAKLPVDDKKLVDTKSHSRVRRTELDRLNEDVKFILDTDAEKIGCQTKRACTENKTPNYCEIGPEAPLKAPPKEPEETPIPPPKKKKKKKYEVFSYRTRRRSKRKKPTIPAVAALAEVESGADGTESSLGGGDFSEVGENSLLEEAPEPAVEEAAPVAEEFDEKDAYQPPAQVRVTREEMTEEEKAFKNIHPEMHSLSKYISTCAVCKFSGRYVTTHYMNSHRMSEMVVSRLPPKAQDRLMKGQGVDSVFTGKDPFQNRVYQYTCPFCNVKKNYARKIWSQHFGSHTGEYKYKCSGCGYMSVNVRGHIMKYCPGSKPIMLENLDRGQDIVAHICKLCNYIQMNREHVMTHIENQHEITEGCSELISEITLFRSDLSNLNTCNGKKLKIVEASVKSTPPPKQKEPAIEPPKAKQAITEEAEGSSESEEEEEEEEEGAVGGEIEASGSPRPVGKLFIPKPPEGQTLKNIYPYIHSQSEYVTRCVLCNYAGKFITKHYVKEHPDDEVFVARIPPDRQTLILNNQQLTKLGPVTVVKYKNYYRHSACPFCPVEKSSQRFDWVMHFAIHTGEYKFRCTQCNHYGNARNEFARHFKNGCPKGKLVRLWSCYKYNEEDPVIGFFCKLCNYIQMSRKNVQRHLQTQHGSAALNAIQQITLFHGNPRYKGRRSVKGGKKGKRAKRKIKHTSDTGIMTVPDFLCEGVVDEEFMAEEESMMDEAQLKEREKSKSAEDDELVLPMHQISADFGDASFEHLFQMEMNETGAGEPPAAPAIESASPQPPLLQAEKSDKTGEEQELVRPDEDPPQNIHSEMHAMSPYASKCLLCDFGGKYIAKHYMEEHSQFEVFASRLPPEAQRNLLSGEGSQPIKCVIRSRKMNYYFSCPFCKLERDCTRHNWVAHFAIHTGEYKYQCSQCSHVGNATRDFKRHFKGNCRAAKQVRQWPDLVSKEEPIMAHYCNLCNYIQLDRGRVVDHLKTQHKCYEQLISKIMLLFIDPKTQMETAVNGTGYPAITAAAAVKRKFFKRRLGKHRKKRPISKMWSVSSQKRAWLNRRNQQSDNETEEEEEEEGDEEQPEGDVAGGSDGDFDDGEEEHVPDGGDGDKDTEDVIEIEDSDEDQPPAKETSSSLNSYEKIKRFIEQTELKAKGAISLTKSTPIIKQEKPSTPPPRPPPPLKITLPFEPPTKDRPLSNIHPEMHSQSTYSKKCILCPFVGRHLINHYISFHPRFEVPISRLPPQSQKLLFANKANLAVEVETNPFSPKLFSYTCLFCDTEFTFSIKSWVDHIGTHTGEYNFKCSQCSRMINTKTDILEHIKQYCKKGKALARQFPVTEKQQLLAHICKMCNFIQMNRGNIVQHLRVQHKIQSTSDQITQIKLLQFAKNPAARVAPKPIIPKKDDRIKVENTKYDTRYTTKEFVKVEQSDAIYEILVPETELSVPPDTATTSATIKKERNADNESGYLMRTRNLTRQSMPGGAGGQTTNPRPTVSAITLRRSVPATPQPSSSQQSASSVPSNSFEAVKRVSHLGYSYTLAGVTKYHCCVRDCTFTPTTVPISLATHIMDDHPMLLWEGYCRECQGHVATGKNMKLTKEIQHLFEHTRKRPADLTDSKEGLLVPGPPPKLQRRTDLGPHRPGMPGLKGPNGDSPDQIIARFANNRSITITRESKANEASASILPPLTPIPSQNSAVANKQQQVLKEVKRTALKPWTVSKSIKTENIVEALLSDISLFAFFKCMGNDCQYTTNDSNKMAEHLTLHSERADKDKKSDQPAESNVFSWLECCYCSTWAGTVMQLIAHITAKHSRDIYQCPYCFYRSCEEYNVGIHIKHYHRQLQTSILFCFGRRWLKPGGELAIFTVKRMKCISCPINFMNPIAFATHVAEYTDFDLGGDIYKCYYCFKKHTKSIIEFARHIVEHRPVRKADSYRCYKCFKDQSQHTPLANTNNIKAYQCVHCAYSIDDEAQIGLHMAQVHASNLLFCGLRIRSNNSSPIKQEDGNNRLDNGAAFFLLKKRIDEKLLYRCPYTPTQLNYLDTKLEMVPKTKKNEPEDMEIDEGPSVSPVITQNPVGLKIAQVQSITNTEFASFITIDDDDD